MHRSPSRLPAKGPAASSVPNLSFLPIPKIVATSLPLSVKIVSQDLNGAVDPNFSGECRLSTSCVIFRDDFGSSSLDQWTVFSERGKESDRELSCSVVPCTSRQAGTFKSLCIKGGVRNATIDRQWSKGISHDFNGSLPTSFSFCVKTSSEEWWSSVMFLTDENERIILAFYMNDGIIGIENELISHPSPIQTTFVANQWIKVCLKFDWKEHQFDLSVDNIEIARQVPFEDSFASNLGKIYLCNNDIRSETHWANFLVLDDECVGLPTITPSSIRLTGGEWSGQVELSSPCQNVAIAAAPATHPHLVRHSDLFDTAVFHVDAISASNQLAFLHEMGAMLRGGAMSDIVFRVEGRDIPAHRAILAGRSLFFKSMFMSGMKESEQKVFDIDNTSFESFQMMLDFLYTGHTPTSKTSPQTLLELFILSDRYLLPGLKRMAEATLRHSIAVDTVVPVLQAADRFSATELVKACHVFIVNNFRSVVQHPSYETLEPKLMLSVQLALIPFVCTESTQKRRRGRDEK